MLPNSIYHEALPSRIFAKIILAPVLSVASTLSGDQKADVIANPLSRILLHRILDPTWLPPPGYSRSRADCVYSKMFQRVFEYLISNRIEGDIFEFGVLLGYSARWLARCLRAYNHNGDIWLFDSFEGLPSIEAEPDLTSHEVRSGIWKSRSMHIGVDLAPRIQSCLSRVCGAQHVYMVVGFFEDTLPSVDYSKKAALVHIDCDLYSSTKEVLQWLADGPKLINGAVVLCDDYNSCRASSDHGERRAIIELNSVFTLTEWFSYGWHGQAFFWHERA